MEQTGLNIFDCIFAGIGDLNETVTDCGKVPRMALLSGQDVIFDPA